MKTDDHLKYFFYLVDRGTLHATKRITDYFDRDYFEVYRLKVNVVCRCLYRKMTQAINAENDSQIKEVGLSRKLDCILNTRNTFSMPSTLTGRKQLTF